MATGVRGAVSANVPRHVVMEHKREHVNVTNPLLPTVVNLAVVRPQKTKNAEQEIAQVFHSNSSHHPYFFY